MDEPFCPHRMSRHDTPVNESPAPRNSLIAKIQHTTNTVVRTSIQPYLGLPARLSLTIMSLPLLSLLLSLSQLLSANRTAQYRAEDAKEQIRATCRGVEQAANWFGNGGMQRVMAEKVNEGLVVSVRGTLKGLRFILMESLTIIEKVIGFIIDTYRSLLMCTIELVVRGVLGLLIGAVDAITDGITTALDAIRLKIQSDIVSANQLIAATFSGINKVTSLVDIDVSVPQFDIPSLSALQNVSVPTGFEGDLRKLNASIPSLDELRETMTRLIEIPFERMKAELNETFGQLIGNVTLASLPTFDSAAAQTDSALQICDNMDVSFVDEAAASLARIALIGTALVVTGFFLLWIALIAWEWYNYRIMKEQAEYIEARLERDEPGVPRGMVVVQVVEHPVLEKYTEMAFQRFRLRSATRSNLRWFFAYIFHAPAVALLCFGLLSLLVIQCQIGAIGALRKDTTEGVATGVADSTSSIVQQLNAASLVQSQRYVNQTNAAILEWQKTIDEELFGPWLDTMTVGLNSTLEEFYDKVENVLNITFGGTILETAVNTFMYCILGSKIDNLQTALTWIHSNANVKLPLLDANALILSDQTSRELATPLASAAAGTGTGEDGGGVIGKIFDAYERELADQRIIALLFCGLYLVIVFVGLAVLLRHTIWPQTSLREEHDLLEKPLVPPTKRGRHDDQASYFELEDVPLRPQLSNLSEKYTAEHATRPTIPPSKPSLLARWQSSGIRSHLRGKS